MSKQHCHIDVVILIATVQLRLHLEYLYLQILSVVTQSQLHAIFTKRSNFDLRRLLEGSYHPTLSPTHSSLPILTFYAY